MAVVIYHAKFAIAELNPVPGGFIGVDIFFVISGYLITAILLRETANDSFTFRHFYERRARRILPVLFVVILVSVPYAWANLLPAEFTDYAASALAAVFFGSNFWFWHGDGYWATESALRPMLHTWSLGIEEQFYLLFPVFLILMRKRSLRCLGTSMVIIFLTSLLIAQYSSTHYPQAAFFLLPARAWELMVGALLAYSELSRRVDFLPATVKAVLPMIGLGMIIASIFLFSSATRHPSLLTLIPVGGTALIIRYAAPSDPVTKLLASRPFVAIGLISYSLYLWHFPLFAFEFIKGDNATVVEKIINIVLAMLFATASYFWIEKPTRNVAVVGRKAIFSAIGTGSLLLVVICGGILFAKGVPDRFTDFRYLLAYEDYQFEEAYLSHRCFLHEEDMTAEQPYSRCVSDQSASGKPSMLVWGDSAAAHLIPGFRRQFSNTYELIFRTSSGCGAFIGFVNPRRPGCRELNDEILDWIQTQKPDKVVIAGWWQNRYNHLALLEKTLAVLAKQQVDNVVILGPVPNWQKTLPRTLIEYGARNPKSKTLPLYLNDAAHQQQHQIETELEALAQRYNASYVSQMDLLCDERGCLTNVADGVPLQWDIFHLTEEGSTYLANELAESGAF